MHSNLEKALLKCDISDGMFPEERAVQVKDFAGNIVDMFASARLVKGSAISVTVLGRNETGATWISLPTTPLNSGAVIVVNSGDLAAWDASKQY